MRAAPLTMAAVTNLRWERALQHRSFKGFFYQNVSFSPSFKQQAACFSSTNDANDSNKHEKSRNDVSNAIFPHTLPDPEGQSNNKLSQYPKTYAGWKRVFVCAWKSYRSTWEGFVSGSSTNDKKGEKSELEAVIDEERDNVSSNIEKNVKYVEKEAPKFFEFVQKESRIYTKEDLKRWAGDQLKLATLCLNEFMAGYRSRRDEEMDKMLNEYFKEVDDQADGNQAVAKRQRRKPKRLVRTA
jgi:hypothetical protein